jgi:hypothetical protein
MRLIRTVMALGLIVGCDRKSAEITVQNAPKQPRPVMQAQMPSASMGDPHGQAPGTAADARPIHWTVPDGWKELPGASMRFATLLINDNPKVELTVIPLSADSGTLLANVNRWEGQIGSKPSTEADLAKVVTRIEVDKHPVDVVDLLGPETANPRQRMLGAIMQHGGRTWYFKLQGPQTIVDAQKEKFDAFVRSIRFDDDSNAVPQAERQPSPNAKPPIDPAQGQRHAARESAGGVSYTVPAGWVKAADRPMRIATFTVGGPPQQAEMIASKFPVNSGTVLENFNRWRGQVGMPRIQRVDEQTSKPIRLDSAEGIFVDLTGAQQRMLVAWVTRGDDWWFFKLTGPIAVIESQQAAFDSYLKSIKFAGDRGEPKP